MIHCQVWFVLRSNLNANHANLRYHDRCLVVCRHVLTSLCHIRADVSKMELAMFQNTGHWFLESLRFYMNNNVIVILYTTEHMSGNINRIKYGPCRKIRILTKSSDCKAAIVCRTEVHVYTMYAKHMSDKRNTNTNIDNGVRLTKCFERAQSPFISYSRCYGWHSSA